MIRNNDSRTIYVLLAFVLNPLGAAFTGLGVSIVIGLFLIMGTETVKFTYIFHGAINTAIASGLFGLISDVPMIFLIFFKSRIGDNIYNFVMSTLNWLIRVAIVLFSVFVQIETTKLHGLMIWDWLK
jgi:hypothetical protein